MLPQRFSTNQGGRAWNHKTLIKWKVVSSLHVVLRSIVSKCWYHDNFNTVLRISSEMELKPTWKLYTTTFTRPYSLCLNLPKRLFIQRLQDFEEQNKTGLVIWGFNIQVYSLHLDLTASYQHDGVFDVWYHGAHLFHPLCQFQSLRWNKQSRDRLMLL